MDEIDEDFTYAEDPTEFTYGEDLSEFDDGFSEHGELDQHFFQGKAPSVNNFMKSMSDLFTLVEDQSVTQSMVGDDSAGGGDNAASSSDEEGKFMKKHDNFMMSMRDLLNGDDFFEDEKFDGFFSEIEKSLASEEWGTADNIVFQTSISNIVTSFSEHLKFKDGYQPKQQVDRLSQLKRRNPSATDRPKIGRKRKEELASMFSKALDDWADKIPETRARRTRRGGRRRDFKKRVRSRKHADEKASPKKETHEMVTSDEKRDQSEVGSTSSGSSGGSSEKPAVGDEDKISRRDDRRRSKERSLSEKDLRKKGRSSSSRNLKERSSSSKNLKERSSSSKNLKERSSSSKNLKERSSSSKNLKERSSSSRKLQERSSSSKHLKERSSSVKDLKKKLSSRHLKERSMSAKDLGENSSPRKVSERSLSAEDVMTSPRRRSTRRMADRDSEYEMDSNASPERRKGRSASVGPSRRSKSRKGQRGSSVETKERLSSRATEGDNFDIPLPAGLLGRESRIKGSPKGGSVDLDSSSHSESSHCEYVSAAARAAASRRSAGNTESAAARRRERHQKSQLAEATPAAVIKT